MAIFEVFLAIFVLGFWTLFPFFLYFASKDLRKVNNGVPLQHPMNFFSRKYLYDT